MGHVKNFKTAIITIFNEVRQNMFIANFERSKKRQNYIYIYSGTMIKDDPSSETMNTRRE